jgi:hypothetical protein
MTLTQDIGEENKFRVELLECAKLLNLKNDDGVDDGTVF